jgi:hypothetical protein
MAGILAAFEQRKARARTFAEFPASAGHVSGFPVAAFRCTPPPRELATRFTIRTRPEVDTAKVMACRPQPLRIKS